MATRDTVTKTLKEVGVKVIGNSEDFGYGEGGVAVSGEEMDGLLDYYGDNVIGEHEFGVSMKVVNALEELGWYPEWYNPGVMIALPE